MEEIILSVENVSKEYRLGQIGAGTLREELQRLNSRIWHKEDPTRRIGAKNFSKNEIFKALNSVSFSVKKGERVGIIGHNGAGKSTLLKLISRVTAPTEGKIFLNGRVASMLEVGTGFHPELTGRENVYMNGAILGMTKKEIDEKIDEIIEFSECKQFIDTPVKRYSSGMYVKLAFSVAAHLNSDIMIMDEVLAVGDMAFQKKCLDKMNEVSRQENRTILYVSHNMQTIESLCNRCLVLNHGQIVYDGDVETAVQHYMNVLGSMSTHNDVSNMRRDTTYYTQYIHTKSVDIIDKEKMMFNGDEKIHCRVSLLSDISLPEVHLRVTYNYKDGTLLGMCTTKKAFSVEAGKEKTVDFWLDISNLPSGIYYTGFIFYQLTEIGSSDNLDAFSPAFYFETTNEGITSNLRCWNFRGWGNVIFPEIGVGN